MADLVIPVEGQPGQDGNDLHEKLIQLICKVVGPESWTHVGDGVSIQYNPGRLSLDINQTQANHKQIIDLLLGLRRLQEVEVAVQTSIVALSPAMAQSFENLAGFEVQSGSEPRLSGRSAFLNDRQVANWMRIFQMQPSTDVMQAPKITVFNGQGAGLNVGDEVDGVPIGLFAKILPVVSADRKLVRLNIDLTDAGIVAAHRRRLAVQTMTLDKIAELPDGATIVYRLGRSAADGKELFVLVKAKVVINSEVQEFQEGSAPPIPPG